MADHYDDALFEAWLDAWCVAWFHVGLAAANDFPASCRCTCIDHDDPVSHRWYQRGVCMGLVGARLIDARYP